MRFRGLRSRCESWTKCLQLECGRSGVFCEKELWELCWDIRANLNVKDENCGRKGHNIRSAEMASELSKEQKQLMRNVLVTLFPLRSEQLNCRHVFLTFMAFCALGSPSSMSSRRIPPSPRWSCLSKSLSRAFLSFKLYLGLKAYFPSTTSIFGLLTRACNRDRNFKAWNSADATFFWCAFEHMNHTLQLPGWRFEFKQVLSPWILDHQPRHNSPRHRAPLTEKRPNFGAAGLFVYLFSSGKSSATILYTLLGRSSSIPFWYSGSLWKKPGASFWKTSAKSNFPHNQHYQSRSFCSPDY